MKNPLGIDPLELLQDTVFQKSLRSILRRHHQKEPTSLWRLGVIDKHSDDVRRGGFYPLKMAVIGAAIASSTEASEEIGMPIFFFGMEGLQDAVEAGVENLFNHIWEKHLLRTVWDGWLYKHKVKVRNLLNGYVSVPDDLFVESLNGLETYIPLDQFLREINFPLREDVRPGENLFTQEISKLVVVDRQSRIRFVDEDFFVHRSLVDEEGNLIYLGLDEGIEHLIDDGGIARHNVDNLGWAPFPVYFRAWRGYGLIKYMEKSPRFQRYHDIYPLFRFTCFPETTTKYMPLLDHPLYLPSLLEVYLRSNGTGTVYKPRPGYTNAGLVNKLEELWDSETKKCDYSLLALVRNQDQHQNYLAQKEAILANFFEVMPIDISYRSSIYS